MLRIAIVDDMQKDRELLEGITYEIANDWCEEFDVKMFPSGEAISRAAKNEEYDIILLDIQMEGIDGVKTARLLNNITPNSSVVFITSHDERVKSLFDFNIIGFIDKPVTRESIEKVLKKVVDRMEASDYFSYSINGFTSFVNHAEILYFYRENRKIMIQLADESIRFSDTLENVWGQLEEFDEFCKVNRSYIVNLAYVKKLKSNEIEIRKEGKLFTSIIIGRNRKTEWDRKYMNYMRKIVRKGK